MQASELRPGQFFEYEGRRCMWAGVERGGCTFWNYVCFEDGCMVLDYETQNFEVTPLSVTGWDDEPQTKAFGCCDTPSCNNHVIHQKYDADGLVFCDECKSMR